MERKEEKDPTKDSVEEREVKDPVPQAAESRSQGSGSGDGDGDIDDDKLQGTGPGTQIPPDNLPLPGTGTNGKPIKK